MRSLTAFAVLLSLAGCGVIYQSPSVSPVSQAGNKVQVVPMTAETVLVANRSSYQPRTLPAIFSQTSGVGSGLRGSGATPEPSMDALSRPAALETRVPPEVNPGPYRIGVGDVLILATPQVGTSVEQLSGLLAAQNARQGYTVQDDGSIAIPNVGRIRLSGMTLEEAEAELFQRLVESQIDPSFSIEIAEFNSKKVSVGGAVAMPTVEPITLVPLYLDEALTAAGGITVEDQDYASVRIYRDGTLYQIPLNELYSSQSLRRIQLLDGDSVFVDTAYDLEMAQSYFAEQIRLSEFKQNARIAALNELNSEVSIQRANLDEARDNFLTRTELDGVDRDYVYLTGEVGIQNRYVLPYGRKATLADAVYSNGGIPTRTGNISEIYVLRGSSDPREFASITAWHLNAKDATNFLLATRFEMRPDDVVFVAEQPVTRWARVVQQITPSIITSGTAVATD